MSIIYHSVECMSKSSGQTSVGRSLSLGSQHDAASSALRHHRGADIDSRYTTTAVSDR